MFHVTDEAIDKAVKAVQEFTDLEVQHNFDFGAGEYSRCLAVTADEPTTLAKFELLLATNMANQNSPNRQVVDLHDQMLVFENITDHRHERQHLGHSHTYFYPWMVVIPESDSND